MESNRVNRELAISPTTRMLASIAISVFVLIAVMICALLVFRPHPPFPPTVPLTDLPTHTPPPTFTPIPSATAKATWTPVPSPTPIVIHWRELGYLTVVEYTAKTVVEEKGEKTIWGTDWVLLEVVGKVQAGVDMMQIRDQDVVINGTSVEIVLPAPTVTSVELLFDQTHA